MKPLHNHKVTVWWRDGHYFSEDERRNTAIVTSDLYVVMVETFVMEQLKSFSELDNLWLQQNGAKNGLHCRTFNRWPRHLTIRWHSLATKIIWLNSVRISLVVLSVQQLRNKNCPIEKQELKRKLLRFLWIVLLVQSPKSLSSIWGIWDVVTI